MKYTLVQHSGYGYNRDPQFEKAVELFGLINKTTQNKVVRAGGVLVDDYGQASELEQSENYPKDVQGMTPQVRGKFSNKTVGGLRIYIPEKT